MTDAADPKVMPSVLDAGGAANVSERFFGGHLDDVIIEACHDHIHDIRWFRTDWQRGGALTGYARYDADDGEHEVVIKLPVPPQERRWLMRLQPESEYPEVVPRLFAEGTEIGGYDLAWVVMEKLPHGPLDSSWDGRELNLIVDAIGRFYCAAERYPVNGAAPKQEDWDTILKTARENVRKHELPDSQKWNQALKELKKRLKKLLPKWQARDTDHWVHGDLHCGNAMTRQPPPDGPALLFDLAEIRPGHWIEDAVNFERIYWSRPQRLGGVRVIKEIANQRKKHGLPVDSDWPQLANIRRLMLAAAAPAFPQSDHEPSHLRACLHQVNQLLPIVH